MTAYPQTKAVFLAAKSQWNEAIQYFEDSLKILKIQVNPHNGTIIRANYSWVLNKQGHIGEAQVQIEETKRINELLEKSFRHSNVQAAMIAPTEVEKDKEFNIWLDIANIGKKPASLVRVEGFIVPEFKIKTFTDNCSLKNGFISLKKKILEPFQVEHLKFSLQATKTGIYNISPQVEYIDSNGETRTCKPNSVTLTVKPKNSKVKLENTIIPPSQILTESASFETPQLRTTMVTKNKFEFKTETAEKIFNFLIHVFVEDYMKRRITQEKSGWRSLNEIVEEGKIPRYSVYGKGRGGVALSELERRGLVEARIFPGERGRGGKIIRVRVCYDKETIKREIDSRVMKAP